MYERVYAAIDLDAIAENFKNMRANIDPNTRMIAVIKTDGYGHGAVPIANMVEAYDYIWGFAVATAEEAFELRANQVTKPILILGYTFEEHFDEMVKQDIRPAVFQYHTAQLLSNHALSLNKKIRIHLAVDTGMGRIGFLPDLQESIEDIKKIKELPGMEIEGMFTHFSTADTLDKSSAMEQIRIYREFADILNQEGIEIPIRHCSNSAGILEIREANMDMVRAGITIYGIYPSDEVSRKSVALKPAMSIKSHIVYIKEVKPGVSISYGATYTTTRTTRIATIPVGYGDGYPRSLSNKGHVLIHGKKAPILGRICMDQFMVDVTEIPEALELDEVVLMGRSGECEITVDELGHLSGRFPYEFVCDIGKRVPRVYVQKGEMNYNL